MAFLVEDGTGLAAATSLVDVATADTFWLDRGDVTWTGTAAVKQAALIKASDYIRNNAMFRWRGQKSTYAQSMPFPRTGCTERFGQAVPSNVVPWQVAQSTCYLARAALTAELMPDLAHGGMVKSEKIDVLETSYAEGALPTTTIQFVAGLLSPLLLQDWDPVNSVYYQNPNPAGFTSALDFTLGTYNNNRG